MNDKKKHLRRCFRIAVCEYKDFTTTTSNEQYFLNEKNRENVWIFKNNALPLQRI